MSESVLVEACVDSIESALAAARGGAHGIELCANLVEGGTTPSAGTLAVCRERLDIPIHVLVRPRGGDFLYTATEFTVLLEDRRRAGPRFFRGAASRRTTWPRWCARPA